MEVKNNIKRPESQGLGSFNNGITRAGRKPFAGSIVFRAEVELVESVHFGVCTVDSVSSHEAVMHLAGVFSVLFLNVFM